MSGVDGTHIIVELPQRGTASFSGIKVDVRSRYPASRWVQYGMTLDPGSSFSVISTPALLQIQTHDSQFRREIQTLTSMKSKTTTELTIILLLKIGRATFLHPFVVVDSEREFAIIGSDANLDVRYVEPATSWE